MKEFSKGMKVKLSIAVALSHHPKLLALLWDGGMYLMACRILEEKDVA